MTFEEHLELAKSQILSATRDKDWSSSPSTFYAATVEKEWIGGVAVKTGLDDVCHAQLSMKEGYYSGEWKTPIILASNCQYANENEEQSLAYLDWIMDPLTSPWKNLMGGTFHKIYNRNDKIMGFYWDQEEYLKHPFLLFKNFCVAARQAFEYPDNIRAWFWARAAGFDPALSFLFASYVRIDDNKDQIMRISNDRAGGIHWPITPYGSDGGIFALSIFKAGKPRWTKGSVNGCWTGSSGIAEKDYHGLSLLLKVPDPNNPWSSNIIEKSLVIEVLKKYEEELKCLKYL